MTDNESLKNKKETTVERSTSKIREDIAKGEESISQTVEQISERFQEKLEWRGYVKNSPYWAMGVAVGLGYLASGMFQKRMTPTERLMGSISKEARSALGGLITGVAAPSLIKMTLLGMATKAATGWLKNATALSDDDTEPQPLKGKSTSPSVGKHQATNE